MDWRPGPGEAPQLSLPVTLNGWALIPGPARMDHIETSITLQELSEHDAAAIAESILAFPGTRLVHPGDPTWWEWMARWEQGERFIEIGMTLFEEPKESWGGSEITANCTAGDVLALWSFLQERHTGIWLHDPDCDMHTHRSFLAKLKGEDYWI